MPLYHFTDCRNCESIKKHGLLSWEQLRQKGIESIPASDTFSRNRDHRNNLQNFIHLCLTAQHSMTDRAISEKRIESIIWLKIDDSVIERKTTLFCNQNSTANAAYWDDNPKTAFDSKLINAEVLVEGSIAPDLIYIYEEIIETPF